MPDISKWNVNKVENFKELFYNCFCLLPFPNKFRLGWINVEENKELFNKCSQSVLLVNSSTELLDERSNCGIF